MANLPSQIKRNRQNERRRQLNRSVRSRVTTVQRRFRRALDDGDRDAAEAAFRAAARELDKAARKGVIHPNKAANRKSRMARKLHAL